MQATEIGSIPRVKIQPPHRGSQGGVTYYECTARSASVLVLSSPLLRIQNIAVRLQWAAAMDVGFTQGKHCRSSNGVSFLWVGTKGFPAPQTECYAFGSGSMGPWLLWSSGGVQSLAEYLRSFDEEWESWQEP